MAVRVRTTLSRLFRVMTFLLVLTMVGHVAGAAAHAALCRGNEHTGHSHPDGHGSDHDHGEVTAAADTAVQVAPGHHGGDHEKPGTNMVTCHGTVAGCSGCSVASMTLLPMPRMDRDAVLPYAATFSSTEPGVEHRPPIAAL